MCAPLRDVLDQKFKPPNLATFTYARSTQNLVYFLTINCLSSPLLTERPLHEFLLDSSRDREQTPSEILDGIEVLV